MQRENASLKEQLRKHKTKTTKKKSVNPDANVEMYERKIELQYQVITSNPVLYSCIFNFPFSTYCE